MKKKKEKKKKEKEKSRGEGKKFRASPRLVSPRLAVGVKRYQLCYATLMNVPLETATRREEGRGRERGKREKWREEKRERERERERASA